MIYWVRFKRLKYQCFQSYKILQYHSTSFPQLVVVLVKDALSYRLDT